MTETAQIINDFLFNDYNIKITLTQGLAYPIPMAQDKFNSPSNFLRMTNDELALMMGVIDTSVTFFEVPHSFLL